MLLKVGSTPSLCDIHKDAVVCQEAKVQGAHSIKVGEGTVIHPACILHAKAGPIVIGRFNVLEEQVEVVNSSDQPLVIGDHNVLEVGARVLGGGGPRLGDANLLEIRATLDEGCSVGSGCTLGACTSLKEGEALGDEMVVIGPGVRHGEPGAKDAHVQAVLKYIEVLKETLPRCHHLRKSNAKS
ncbi:Dynactin subunit 6 [Symbiodinium microadriaticum]|uniref:Dynactin subunit 6 n=1 Tax=Symbiodinium microadriaticum TaxID=2951 RepID=A0A1Q9CVI4_SYMMI|nr:Dynactin subunit 6 [Symbiodinium microadriaticum]